MGMFLALLLVAAAAAAAVYGARFAALAKQITDLPTTPIGEVRAGGLVEVKGVVTNKTPNAPYRGAGRPEVVFAVERAVDCLARALDLDPAELRRRNLIRPDEMPYDLGMPYRDGNPLVYDGGDFPATLAAALDAGEYAALRQEQAELRQRGVYRGIGLAAYVEGTGIGPYEAQQHLDDAGLPRAVGAEQAEHLAPGDREGDVVDGGPASVPLVQAGAPDRRGRRQTR